MVIRIRIIGMPQGPTPFDGKWIAEYDPALPGKDPSGQPMLAHLRVVDNPKDALGFEDPKDAFTFWRRSHGQRPDGKPNRPLTAFTVDFIHDGQ